MQFLWLSAKGTIKPNLMKRFLLTTSALTIFSAGIGSAFALISSAPAFNSELRRENVVGQSILARGSDMYDRAQYLMQQAVSFIRADLIPYDGPEGTLAAPVEVSIQRGETAVALMQESLTLNPGNAQGWTALAWAHLYSGDRESAVAALKTSWALAPYNRSLATERLDMSLALFDPNLDIEEEGQTGETPLPSNVRVSILRDLETLRSHIPSVFRELAAELQLLSISTEELPDKT